MSLDISYSGGVFSAPQAKSVGTVTSTSGDANFADVSLLLHGDGTSGSTTIIDSSSSPKTITVNGNAQIDTTIKKFGTGSIEFDGTGDYLTAPDDAAWDLGSSDFTIEAWVYPTASPAQPIIVGQWTSSYAWVLLLSNDGNRYLRGLLYNGSFNDYVSTSALSLNSWNHCAFVREGNTVSLYLNGTSVYSTTFTGSVSTSTSALSIGANSVGGSPFQGYLDDVRVTNGTARYTSNFTPPTAAFPNAAAFIDLDLSTGNYFNHTLSANTLVSFSNAPASGTAAGFALALTGANVAEAYDLANASYDSVSGSVSTDTIAAYDLFFKPDGTKVYITDNGPDEINEYNLTTAWDLSTLSYVQNFDVSTQESNTSGTYFKPDGTKMYVTGAASDGVYEYDLSTAWDISTATHNQTLSIGSQESTPRAIYFKPDGTKMFITGQTGDEINEYSLSTAWDISTATHSNAQSISSEETSPQGLFLSPNGDKLYVVGVVNNDVFQYTLTTAWDTSTMSYDGVSFDLSSQEVNPTGLSFKSDGSKMYITGLTNTIYQYSTQATSTATFTYPSSVKFPSGTAPAGPAIDETDVLVFYTDDGGTTYQGFRAGNAMA